MAQSHSMDGLLNNLLSDQMLGKDLSADDKAAVRAMVGELMGELPELNDLSLFDPDAPTETPDSEPIAPDSDAAIAELDGLIAELGIEPIEPSQDVTLAYLLNEQSDKSLIELLSDHVDLASDVVEVLSTRPRKGQMLDAMRRVELQLMALSIGVADLRQTLEQKINGQPTRLTWQHQVRALLLREFNFINHLVR